MYRVLVIDDEVLLRQGIIAHTDWAAMGCRVVGEAADGEQGLALVHQLQPDILICDIKMPKMDGLTMLQRLREQKNPIKCIFLSAYGEFSYAQRAVKLLASDYLLKPFRDAQLAEVLGRVVEQLDEQRRLPPQMPDLPRAEGGEKSKYVVQAMAYIHAHYAEPEISVAAIAQAVGLSEGHLSRLFRSQAACTVAAYLTQTRMRQACALLGDCRNKVYEVAEQVGYRDIAHFSASFKRLYGKTPSEYQKKV